MAVFAAVDLGASSGRIMAGIVDRDTIRLEQVHRFPNQLAERDGHLRWDVRRLFDEVRTGLADVQADSVGIDTWAVDYGLLGEDGELLADPIAYRDERTADVIDAVHALVSPAELYDTNGLQFLPFTTLYQLASEQRGPLWERVAHAVLLPDLLAYWLTGKLRTESTNASTTGLLDVRTKDWSDGLLDRLGLRRSMLPPLELPGTVRGYGPNGVAVTTVGSHDTASAVVGVPATAERFAYIVSGTWSLVGLELDSPVLTRAARSANFTNEGGVDGRTRFLRNVGGLWLLQECIREWGLPLEPLLAEAASLPAGGPTVDVDDPSFIPRGRMGQRIATATGQPLAPAATVRCVLDSLALAYARTIHTAVDLTGVGVDVIHIVGGGSQNELLCQLTADLAGLPVVAGPVEATAYGNVAVQARAHGHARASLEAIRAGLAGSLQLRRYEAT